MERMARFSQLAITIWQGITNPRGGTAASAATQYSPQGGILARINMNQADPIVEDTRGGVATDLASGAAAASLGTKIRSGYTWATVANFGRQGIGFVISMLLARLLLPADY